MILYYQETPPSCSNVQKDISPFLFHVDPPERAIPGGEYHQEEPHEPEESQHAIPGRKDEESQLLSEGNCTSVIF